MDNGDAVHDWCVAGYGIMLKSMLDVADDLMAGRLERILTDWTAGEMPIVALFPDRATMPRKTRVFLDAMTRAFETAS